MIKNAYIHFLEELRTDIAAAPGKILTDFDLWTRDQTGDPYIGLLGQWIHITDVAWQFRTEVIAFSVISGQHSGDNIEKYIVKFLDRVSITSKIVTNAR